MLCLNSNSPLLHPCNLRTSGSNSERASLSTRNSPCSTQNHKPRSLHKKKRVNPPNTNPLSIKPSSPVLKPFKTTTHWLIAINHPPTNPIIRIYRKKKALKKSLKRSINFSLKPALTSFFLALRLLNILSRASRSLRRHWRKKVSHIWSTNKMTYKCNKSKEPTTVSEKSSKR